MKEWMIKTAKETGFYDVNMIQTNDFVFVPEYRKFCEDNLCGNYGKNYGCPPVCGTPYEMKEKALKWNYALVLQSKTSVSDAFDEKTTKELKKRHTTMTLELIRKIKDKNPAIEGIPIMAGPCNYCKVCEIENHKECSHPQMRFSCLSAYCIDVNELVQKCGMSMQWTREEVSLFSIWLFK